MPDPICQACAEREPQTNLHPDALARLVPILGTHLLDVFSKHREIESKAKTKNVIGRQNLVEALSHISVLFQQAPTFDRDEQLEQVAYIEDHLRRVMMEAFELATYDAIADLIDNEFGPSLERQYYRRVAPLIRIGKLQGHITPAQYEKRFKDILEQCVSARKAKNADGDWDAWNTASTDLQNATIAVGDLKREVRAAIDAAHESWRFWVAISLAILLFILSLILL
ncbi:MAG: hypothetical protein ACXW15_08590 [Acidimicrobiia bacterium]